MTWWVVAGLAVVLAGCGGNGTPADDGDTPAGTADAGTTPEPGATDAGAEVELVDAAPLGDDAAYVVSAVVDGEPVELGRIAADDDAGGDDADDRLTRTLPVPEQLDVDRVEAVHVAVGAADGDHPVLLAGDVDGGEAALAVDHPRALGEAASGASGTVLLGTPTAPQAPETAGLWFLETSPSRPSLQLPALPAGWRWQGWAHVDDEFFSAGRFDAADQPAAGPHNGPEAGPDLPGGDFVADPPPGVDFPLELHGARAVLSLAPADVELDAPLVEVLAAELPDPADDHVGYPLEAVDTQPRGRVTLSE